MRLGSLNASLATQLCQTMETDFRAKAGS